MSTKLIILADLGTFKAYRVIRDETGLSSPRLEIIEELAQDETRGRLLDKVTDKAGRFPAANGAAQGGMSIGENHNLETEMNRRTSKRIADGINALVKRENPGQWYFAAAKEINSRILNELEPPVLSRLKKNVPADLVKVDKSELLGRF